MACTINDIDNFTLAKIFEYCKWRDLRAINCVSRRFNKVSETLYTARQKSIGGISSLRSHQIHAIEQFENYGPAHTFAVIGYMSSGKTLIGLESAFTYIKQNPDKNCLIFVKPTTQRTWIDEAEKHFPKSISARNILAKKIFVVDSTRQRDVLFVKQTYATTSAIHPTGLIFICKNINTICQLQPLLDTIGLVIFDEFHSDYYNSILHSRCFHYMKNTKVLPVCIIGLSAYDKQCIPATKKIYISQENVCKPDVNVVSMTHDIGEITQNINNLFTQNKTKHILVASVNDADYLYFMTNKLSNINVYMYDHRQVTHYKQFEKTGGILWTSIGVVREGLNLNVCSDIYVFDDSNTYYTCATLKQFLGRVIRDNNKYNRIGIVFSFQKLYNVYYWRCQLAALEKVDGFDIKNKDSVAKINSALATMNIDLATLDSIQMFILYAAGVANTSQYIYYSDDEIETALQNFSKSDLAKLMLY